MHGARRWGALLAGVGVVALAAIGPAGAEETEPRISDGGPQTARALPHGSRPRAAGALDLIDTTNKGQVVDAYLDQLVDAEKVQPEWTGSVGGCRPGTETSQSKNATVQAINFFRSMAGLGPVVRNESYEDEAVRSALMMQAENNLSHFPGAGWACYTVAGAAAAAQSNIALGSTGARAIHGFMDEPGAGNPAVGHRRWFLYPQLRKVGTGSTSNASTVRVIETRGAEGLWGDALREPMWVTWPNDGYIPWSIVPSEGNPRELHRWSLSSPKFPSADYSDAKVEMTMDGTELAVTEAPVDNRYANNTLVWNANRRSGDPFPRGEVVIRVTVSGIKNAGGTTRYSYAVKPFPLDVPGAPGMRVPQADGQAAVANWGDAAPNGSPVNAYEVELIKMVEDDKGGWNQRSIDTKMVEGNANSTRFSGLPDAWYTFQIRARNKVGWGEKVAPSQNNHFVYVG